eukprot:scaffold1220_cov259-Pinguiococcus_pyrenoidosus.AAC.156
MFQHAHPRTSYVHLLLPTLQIPRGASAPREHQKLPGRAEATPRASPAGLRPYVRACGARRPAPAEAIAPWRAPNPRRRIPGGKRPILYNFL